MKPLVFHCYLFIVFFGASSCTWSIINYGIDNSGNTTDPGTGAPWSNVAKVCNSDGTGQSGSATYLGDLYMITANHVSKRAAVTFDGINYFARDTGYAPKQVASNVDSKIFKLAEDPGLPSVAVYSGFLEINRDCTLVGWGRGRAPAAPIHTDVVSWGSSSTATKRWGLNEVKGTGLLGYQSGTYNGLITVLGNGVGDSEAAVVTHDSGSALFQKFGSNWFLSGVTTAVEVGGKSTFGVDSFTDPFRGDYNYFVRVSIYNSAISDILQERCLTLGVNGSGGSVGDPGLSIYDLDAVVGISATEDSNYRFGFWSIEGVTQEDVGNHIDDPSAASASITMSEHFVVDANFIKLWDLVSVIDPVGAGSILADAGIGGLTSGNDTYDDGSIVNIQAIEAVGWLFDQWDADLDDFAAIGDPLSAVTTVEMTDDRDLTAKFIDLTIDGDGDGTNNLVEYALGMDLNSVDFDKLPILDTTVILTDNFTTITFTIKNDDPKLSFCTEVSDDMIAWDSDPEGQEIFTTILSAVDNGDGTSTYSIRDKVAFTVGEPRFIRLKVQRS